MQYFRAITRETAPLCAIMVQHEGGWKRSIHGTSRALKAKLTLVRGLLERPNGYYEDQQIILLNVETQEVIYDGLLSEYRTRRAPRRRTQQPLLINNVLDDPQPEVSEDVQKMATRDNIND